MTVRIFVLLLLLLSIDLHAHEIQTSFQHVNLRRQDQSGWQHSLSARYDINRKLQVGALGSYFERFDLYENQVGALLNYKPTPEWAFEVKYLQGKGNEIFPEKQTELTAYYAFGKGFSPFLIYRDSRYSITTTHTVNLGVEIEKIPHIIFIPVVMAGKATFNTPGETEDVNSYGLRVVYYTESKYSFSVFGYRGKEASQGIVGRSSEIIDTLSGGVSALWYFTDAFRGEIIFDHTDYDQLKTEFHTTTLNLTWMF